jgi:hypothetical protein
LAVLDFRFHGWRVKPQSMQEREEIPCKTFAPFARLIQLSRAPGCKNANGLIVNRNQD